MSIKRFFSALCAIVCLAFVFAGCQYHTVQDKEIEEPQEVPYPHDFRCGYMLTFCDSNDENFVSPSSDDFTSDNAVARYVSLESVGNLSYLIVEAGLFVNNGQNSISIKNDPLAVNKSGSITMREEIYYTSELSSRQARLHYIYYNAENKKVYAEDYQTVTHLSVQSSLSYCDVMNATVLNLYGEIENITYTFDFSIEFKQIDSLESVTVTEYDSYDNKINSVTKSSGELKQLNNYTYKYTSDSDCQYIIVNKQYKKADGEIYLERTVYNKNHLSQSEVIYVPYGNGLTMPMAVELSFG